MLNILRLRDQIIQRYRGYVESFVNITDARIQQVVTDKLNSGSLWPEPLLACNPGFVKGDTVQQLIEAQVLHPEMANIFTGFALHQHQSEAMRLGAQKKSFIVTSGTGSGKSLTFLGTIFQGVLAQPEATRNGVKAIIVYPMNALINSQLESLKGYAANYAEATDGGTFPIRFAKYTGQEKRSEKDKIIAEPPHILLTNYMMLELLLTRSHEQPLRDSIFESLEYLVFDELHTYRGRQGADVALLIRRVKALAQQPLTLIGTSATLSSGSISEQKAAVSALGKQLFDISLPPEQVVQEHLQQVITHPLPTEAELKTCLQAPLPPALSKPELLAHPLSNWMEKEVALVQNENQWVRRPPQTVREISQKLATFTGLTIETCQERLDEFLRLLQTVNQAEEQEFLPFRVHQFISQTQPISVTLETPEKRAISSSQLPHIYRGNQRMPLFPVVFNQQSGFPYLCVYRTEDKLIPRSPHLNREPDAEQAEKQSEGYLLVPEDSDEDLWNPVMERNLLPDTWLDAKKNYQEARSDKKKSLPEALYVSTDGLFTQQPRPNSLKAWFIRSPLHLDPISGTIYQGQSRDFNKLMQVGNPGRTITTTLLTYATLQQLDEVNAPKSLRKFMSFTDNRQDAALQTGHFNDFMQQCFLRASIYRALEQQETLDIATIGSAVFGQMGLTEAEFARPEVCNTTKFQHDENLRAFKAWLFYRIVHDLRRGWRHRMPNLEQCALIEVRYKGLWEECQHNANWKHSALLRKLGAEDRYEFLTQFLNYFRSSFALYHKNLEKGRLEEAAGLMQQRLSNSWLYQEDRKIKEPCWLRVQAFRSKKYYTESIGPMSAAGHYVRHFAKQHHLNLDHKATKAELEALLGILQKRSDPNEAVDPERPRLCYLHHQQAGKVDLYQLDLANITWVLGDKKTPVTDKVRTRSFLEQQARPNPFFQALYQLPVDKLKQFQAKEHTGQVPSGDRQEAEQAFRKADIKALYCSPTMELGIDIDDLSVVHMRNVPPVPANYVQRSGRAGRKGQGALILTFCSSFSDHDQYYFQHQSDMVSGKVTPQQLDLQNEDLLRSHLHALYLEHCGITALNKSLTEVIDLTQHPELLLKPLIKQQLQLPTWKQQQLETHFSNIIAGMRDQLEGHYWFDADWVRAQIEAAPRTFDRALDRWRILYREAEQSKTAALSKKGTLDITQKSKAWKAAHSEENHAQRRLDLLKNEADTKDASEFYPFRYLASEGFLPGYNFTRLPIRAFLAKDSGGIYVSRPRSLALEEFGPQNLVYQGGSKYRVDSMAIAAAQEGLAKTKGKVVKRSGYMVYGTDTHKDIDPFGHEDLGDNDTTENLNSLVALQEMHARNMENITCQEDERTRKGYKVDTYFSYRGDWQQVKRWRYCLEEDPLLRFHFLPAAELIKVNHKWRSSPDPGFLLHDQTGSWKSQEQWNEAEEEEKNHILPVKLYTTTTSDCLYLEPQPTLQVADRGAILTFQYALKKALEQRFNIESQEVGCVLLGLPKDQRILFYESAEGSLGILSQLAQQPGLFKEVIARAYAICSYQDGRDMHPQQEKHEASYEDLLSYYNQRDHRLINRSLIKTPLELLLRSEVQADGPTQHPS